MVTITDQNFHNRRNYASLSYLREGFVQNTPLNGSYRTSATEEGS